MVLYVLFLNFLLYGLILIVCVFPIIWKVIASYFVTFRDNLSNYSLVAIIR